MKLVDFQARAMVETGKKAQTTAAAAESLLMTLAIIAGLLAALIGYLITRSITKPVSEVVDAAKEDVSRRFQLQTGKQ